MAKTHAAAFTQARPWSAEEFSRLLDQSACHVVGDAQSFALFRVIADETELLTIATHPDFRRCGHAGDRMEQWVQTATRLGAIRAFLEVAANNVAALALYRRCRFVQCGLRSGYYPGSNGEPVDAIVMERPLP